jgi:hypothetical protein
MGRLAQLVERLPYTQNVGGSSPSAPTMPPVYASALNPKYTPLMVSTVRCRASTEALAFTYNGKSVFVRNGSNSLTTLISTKMVQIVINI